MSVFQHPYLTRGVVKTPNGAFIITRGLVDVPDHVGEALGWRRIEDDDDGMVPRQQPVGRLAASEPRASRRARG